MRVMFYGSLNPTDATFEAVCSFIKVLTEGLLDRGASIMTREGNRTLEGSLVPVDNIVLDHACAYRERQRLPYDRVMSFADRNEYETGNRSAHDRKVVILPVPHRLAMYREMLARSDVVVTIGGKEGVYRLGLFGFALRIPVVPIACTGGTSITLWQELAAAGAISLDDQDAVDLLGAGQVPNREVDIRNLADSIARTAIRHEKERGASTQPSARPHRFLDVVRDFSFGDLLALVGILVAIVFAVASATWTIAEKVLNTEKATGQVTAVGTPTPVVARPAPVVVTPAPAAKSPQTALQ